jgi:hypothetical protein
MEGSNSKLHSQIRFNHNARTYIELRLRRKILMKTNQLVDNTATAKTTMLEADQFSPTGDAIAVLAYKYWTERDRSIGSPEEDWLRAENEIKHNRTPGSVV